MKTADTSQLYQIIPAEIEQDDFYDLIKNLARNARIDTVLEIGSSSGEGSTKAWVEGLRENPRHPKLYCMEVSKVRCEALEKRWGPEGFVECFLGSSVTVDRFPPPEEVEKFLREVPGPLQTYPVEQVLGWLAADIEYIRAEGVSAGGILEIKKKHGIETFGAVLIDGSEFTGYAELDDVYGAEYILMDDILTFKCHQAHHLLMSDPAYELIALNTKVRHGYSAFRRRRRAVFDPLPDDLPVHFFTIVLNGMPFIRHHIEMMRRLPFHWHWHIVEGVSALKHDTAWSVPAGGVLPEALAAGGLSTDGTREYLDEIKALHPHEITIHRKADGALWNGKIEMVSEPLKHIYEETLLWEIDADELWTADQVERGRRLFMSDPVRRAAYFWCRFFVGERLVVSTRNGYSQNPDHEWLRAWIFRPGMRWLTHEPPALAERNGVDEWRDIAKCAVFTHAETEKEGLVFQHMAYATEQQVAFKEMYYGYQGAMEGWRRLQDTTEAPLRLGDYLPWVTDETMVERCAALPFSMLAQKEAGRDEWRFTSAGLPEVAVAASATAKTPVILIDGVFFQHNRTGIGRVWEEVLRIWGAGDASGRIWLLDREGTAPEIPGIRRRRIRKADTSRPGEEALFLEKLCEELGADVFISTYYTAPARTPSVAMVHDMIPELLGVAAEGWEWESKRLHLTVAAKVLTISQSTRKDLLRFHPEISEDDIVLAPPSAPPGSVPSSDADINRFKRQHQITGNYILVVGERFGVSMGLHGYKNAALAFRAWSLLPVEARQKLFIFCAGGKPELEVGLRYLIPESQVRISRLDEQDLRTAYSGAMALVYPSLYEGFGLPVVEAMSCGCPVITCRRGSLPEVGGDAAIYVDAFDPAQLAEVLRRMCGDQQERARLAGLGREQAARFSYERMAETMIKVLDDTARSSKKGQISGLWKKMSQLESKAIRMEGEMGSEIRSQKKLLRQIEKEHKELTKKHKKLKKRAEQLQAKRKPALRRLWNRLRGKKD
jgi:glycosyltransferase involved in cell wall biosynthesis